MIKLSKEQLSKLWLHTTGISNVLLEALLSSTQPETWNPEGDDTIETDEDIEPLFAGLKFADLEKSERTPEQQSAVEDYYDSNNRRREQALSRLLGRWKAGGNRCGIEISRTGEHFILTYLKRNGRPSDDRYILIWLDGDILYYGYGDRITVLALDTPSDTLMMSPGVDYTRVAEEPEK